MKKVFLTVAFVFATVSSFASNEGTNLIKDCWWETYILDDGSEVDSYACSSQEHYDMHVLSNEMLDLE